MLKSYRSEAALRKRGERGNVFSPPKTERGRRTIDIDEKTLFVLSQLRQAQLEERMAFDGKRRETSLLSVKKNGSAFELDVASQRFEHLMERYELPPIRFHHNHDLSHTQATLLLLTSVPSDVVSIRLGHRSVAFTRRRRPPGLRPRSALTAGGRVKRLASKVLGDG